MNKNLFSILFLILISCLTVTASADLNDGLIAHYPLNGDATDVSGNGYNGIIYGALPSEDRFGDINSSLFFDGNDKIVIDAFKNHYWGDKFTVSVWFKRTGQWYNYQGIVNNGYFTNGSWEIRMGREDNGTKLYALAWTNDFPNTSVHLATTASQNEWHHTVLSYDGTSLYLYQDGSQVSSLNITGNILSKNTPFVIGQAGYGNSIEYFYGYIDDVRLYNRALSEAEVRQLYNPEPDIDVDPLAYDFGDVALGTSSTMYVNIANTGGNKLTVDNIYFRYPIDRDPFTAEIPSLPLEIEANSSVDIPVSYYSESLLTQSNDLVIVSNDPDEPVIEVALRAKSVTLTGNPPQAIINIQLYIDYSINKGDLTFTGNGNSGEAHYEALNNMLTSAVTANNGCGNLQAAYKRVDGDTKQEDWIEGPAAVNVAALIQNVMNEMGCK